MCVCVCVCVSVCNLCMAACICVHFNSSVFDCVAHVSFVRPRLCVCVCVCVRRGTWVGSEGNAMLRCPHCPLVMRMPPVCHCRHGYCSKKKKRKKERKRGAHTHRLSSLLMCHRGAGPTAALSPLLHTLCCNYKPASRSTQTEPIMAISSLGCFKAACNFLTRLTPASVCWRLLKSRRSLYLH